MKWEQISLLLTILTTIITASVSIQPIYLTNSLTANSNDFKQSGIMIINVNDYNGSTDTERIQKALDDVPPEGAIVFIPKGIYVASNLTAKSRTIIMGENGTIIARAENDTSPFIRFENKTDFEIVGITFNGKNVTNGTGIQIINGTNFKIINNTFQDIDKRAIFICGTSENFTIQNNTFINTNEAPILIFGIPGTRQIKNFIISNNILINSLRNGKIGVAFASKGLITKNQVVNCKYGIGTRCVSEIVIENNTIKNSESYAIYLGTQPGDTGSSDILITGNIIINCSIGIARYYGTMPIKNVTITKNVITYNRQWDIYADFPASFLSNTITSKNGLRLLEPPIEFRYNIDLNGKPIIPADVNGDGKVDMRDIGLLARLFGLNQNSTSWSPNLDIIADGEINMKDIGYAAKCFGQDS
jgi:hypothetical protein